MALPGARGPLSAKKVPANHVTISVEILACFVVVPKRLGGGGGLAN